MRSAYYPGELCEPDAVDIALGGDARIGVFGAVYTSEGTGRWDEYAGDQFGNEEIRPVDFVEVVNDLDDGMIQLGEHERFVAKALAGDGRFEKAVAQHLDGKIAVQALVACAIAAEHLADLQRHLAFTRANGRVGLADAIEQGTKCKTRRMESWRKWIGFGLLNTGRSKRDFSLRGLRSK